MERSAIYHRPASEMAYMANKQKLSVTIKDQASRYYAGAGDFWSTTDAGQRFRSNRCLEICD